MSTPSLFNDWRLTSTTELPHRLVVALVVAAAVGWVISAFSLWRDRHSTRGALGLIALRALSMGLALAVALQPSLELRQVMHVPNHVAVLLDTSRSMAVRAPGGGPSRAERAAALWRAGAEARSHWEHEGHLVDLFGFDEGLRALSPALLNEAPRGEATRLGEALAEVRTRYGGRDLGALVIVSDGIDTGRIGNGALDAETRTTLSALGAPVHTVAVGESQLRDLSVAAVLADDFAFVRTPVTIEAVIRHHGLGHRQVDVSLALDGRPVDVRSASLRDDGQDERVTFTWVPDHPGQFVFTLSTPVLQGEALSANNTQVFAIKVIRDRVRVLHVCGRPSWDERFLRALLRRDPNVDLVSFFILRTETDDQPWNHDELSLIPFPTEEIFDEQLRSFDLVIFQNFNYAPYGVGAFLPGLRDYVLGGGALAMVGGDLSFANGGFGGTPLGEVLPVELGPETDTAFSREVFKPKLTAEGLAHPVTALSLDPAENERRFARLPSLEGLNLVRDVRPGATVLLTDPAAKTDTGKPAPLVAVAEAGQGRTLGVLTDSLWHWGFLAAGEGDDGRAFQRFWDNAIRWLVRDPALTRLRVEPDRLEYHRGQVPSVRLRSLKLDYTPAPRVAVTLTLKAAEGAGPKPLQTIKVMTGDEGEAQVELAAPPPGAYKVVGEGVIDGRPVSEEKTLIVREEGRELEDVVFRGGVLKELAQTSGGQYTELLDGQGSVPWADLDVRPSREVRVGRQETIAVWAHPLTLLAALGALVAEWWCRRRAGYR
jgi:uncharacterized membrane protein